MKKIIKFTGILLILLSITTNIFAATTNSFNIELQTDETTISKEQKEVVVYVVLSKYDGDGMLGYEGQLEYDKNVFESATITALSDWDKVVYDATTGKFISTTTDAKLQTKIAQITLKLKNNVTAETTQVKINNFILSDGDEENTFNRTIVYNFKDNNVQEKNEQEVNDEEIKDNIDEEPILPDIDVNTTPTEKQEIQKETVKETPKQLTIESVEKNPVDNTKAQNNIPQTGTTAVGIIIISIIVLLGIVGYIKYRSIELK